MQKSAQQALRESIAHLAASTASAVSPSSRKRKQPSDDDPDADSASPKRRPPKRGYAPPETYAHLDALPDHLAPDLDVIFCGINPGHKSASVGHHFANASNHFWKCLYSSGFTPRLVPPAEDAALPVLYRLGLTNLVERPSIEQAELSKDEMRHSVPTLQAKIIAHHPHIVCFVGKGIWEIIEAAFRRQIATATAPATATAIAGTAPSHLDGDGDKAGAAAPPAPPRSSPTTTTTTTTPAATTDKRKHRFNWGLQPYKFVYPALAAGISPVRETLLFVVPSTSGRVVSHQLPDKIALFTRLRADLDRAKAGKALDSRSMAATPLLVTVPTRDDDDDDDDADGRENFSE